MTTFGFFFLYKLVFNLSKRLLCQWLKVHTKGCHLNNFVKSLSLEMPCNQLKKLVPVTNHICRKLVSGNACNWPDKNLSPEMLVYATQSEICQTFVSYYAEIPISLMTIF